MNKPEVDLLLVGDSHANHFTGMIDVLAGSAGLRGYDVTQSNTVFLEGVERFYRQGGETVRHGNFIARNTFIKDELLPRGYDFVVLGSTFASHYRGGMFSTSSDAPGSATPALFRTALETTIEDIIGYGSVPVFITGSPVFGRDVSHCTLNNLRFGRADDCNMPRDAHDETFRGWNNLVAELADKFPQLVVIDPAKVTCDSEA